MIVRAYKNDGKTLLVELDVPDNPTEDMELTAEAYSEGKEKWDGLKKSWDLVGDALKAALEENDKGTILNDARILKVRKSYGIKAANVPKVLEIAPEARKDAVDMTKVNKIIEGGGDVAAQLKALKEVIGETLIFEDPNKEAQKNISHKQSKSKATNVLDKLNVRRTVSDEEEDALFANMSASMAKAKKKASEDPVFRI